MSTSTTDTLETRTVRVGTRGQAGPLHRGISDLTRLCDNDSNALGSELVGPIENLRLLSLIRNVIWRGQGSINAPEPAFPGLRLWQLETEPPGICADHQVHIDIVVEPGQRESERV